MIKKHDMSEQESLALITSMINKAKDSFHDTGVGAMMWGTVVAICALVKWAELQFEFSLPFDINLLTLFCIIPQVVISIKEKRKRKAKSYDDAYMNYIWLAFGICIFLLILIVNTIYASLGPVMQEYRQLQESKTGWQDFRFSEYVAPLLLLIYGIPTFITGAACKFRPMLWGGLFCWACCIIALFTKVKTDLLLTACSAIFAWLIPGIIMEADYRKAKKELAATNV